jgi:hypothetical protein
MAAVLSNQPTCKDDPMTKNRRTRTVVGATVAGLAIAAALVAGPFRGDVSGNAHHLDACLTGANPAACHG